MQGGMFRIICISAGRSHAAVRVVRQRFRVLPGCDTIILQAGPEYLFSPEIPLLVLVL